MQLCPCCVPSKMTSLKEDVRRSAMLCILTVPATMTSHDLMKFVASFYEVIEHMKIIRDSTPNQYMVLIKFSSQVRCCQRSLAAGMSHRVTAQEASLHLPMEIQPCPPSQRIPRAGGVSPTLGSSGCHVLAVLFFLAGWFSKISQFTEFSAISQLVQSCAPSQGSSFFFLRKIFLVLGGLTATSSVERTEPPSLESLGVN